MAEYDMLPAWAAAPPPASQASVLATAEGGQTERVPFGNKAGLLMGRNGQVSRCCTCTLRYCYSGGGDLSPVHGARQVCDLVVEHKSSSRVHACVVHDSQGKAWLIDLGSVHGVTRSLPPQPWHAFWCTLSFHSLGARHALVKEKGPRAEAGAVDLSRAEALPLEPTFLGAEA